MAIKEQTESEFSKHCKKKGYYRLKLQVNVASRTLSGAMMTNSMPSDFLVLTPSETKFIEIKQVTTGDAFGTFKQQYKLTKLSNFFDKGKINNFNRIGCYLLINFKSYKKIVYIEINDYNKLLKNYKLKALKLKDIPDKYIKTWKTLELEND